MINLTAAFARNAIGLILEFEHVRLSNCTYWTDNADQVTKYTKRSVHELISNRWKNKKKNRSCDACFMHAFVCMHVHDNNNKHSLLRFLWNIFWCKFELYCIRRETFSFFNYILYLYLFLYCIVFIFIFYFRTLCL